MNHQQQIFEYISTTLAPSAKLEFDPELNMLETGALDSVAMMELIVWLEDTFAIAIDTDDLTPDNFATISAMASYVENAAAPTEA